VFFFHGWYSSVSEAVHDFALYRQFSASGVKAFLVLPETARDAPDSFGGKLERENGFDALVSELLEKLHEVGAAPRLEVGRITLAGHSGAYRVISRILDQRGAAAKVGEVCLFDALYDDIERYAAWIQASGGRFVSICAEGGDPEDNARELADSLRQKGIMVEVASDEPGGDALSLSHRVVFLSSSYNHSELLSQADEFRRVLAAVSER
jgi:methylmalonyl-CoA mutase cobalamin-binding subunit